MAHDGHDHDSRPPHRTEHHHGHVHAHHHGHDAHGHPPHPHDAHAHPHRHDDHAHAPHAHSHAHHGHAPHAHDDHAHAHDDHTHAPHAHDDHAHAPHAHAHDDHGHAPHAHDAHAPHAHDDHGHAPHAHDAHAHAPHAHAHDDHAHAPHAHDDHTHAHPHRHDDHGHAPHAHDDHSHPHPPDHDHPPRSRRAAPRPELPRGAGHGKILFLDAPSGLAGDMIIAALIDLGVPEVVVANAVAKLPISGFDLHFGTRVRSGIVATSFDVHLEAAQPERTYAAIRGILSESGLEKSVLAMAQATFERLAHAEAKVHKSVLDEVHFHEVGAIDAIVDVVGSAAALEYLGAEVIVSPLPMGRGFVPARHGILPLPAPATVECLRGLVTVDGGIDFEFVTPTGAAIVGAHARGSSRWPSMVPEAVGWGAGTAQLADRPNVLRAVLGKATEPTSLSHTVLETNVDDATGELVASAIESLLAAGALDVWATAITMKKGRPALTLSALVETPKAEIVGALMLRETTSLGVRRYDVSRLERPRRQVQVETPFGIIPVKVAEGPYGPPQVKPEFDACAAAAREHRVPVREVIRAALLAAGTSLP
ncbi:nickel pincer cofactor biosynthesis protein LarC [Pendulispora albinea]|uniref:Putative nickel insertion protein n=1 Tax=Pendulispora albinea TaxID=2741071 RepID=A0ABZ2M5S1_9BACT